MPSNNIENEALRLRLLTELASLRHHFYTLVGNQRADEMNGTTSSQSSALDQSARDAIEAFFNSDDDFTRQFNEGTGSIKRAHLMSLDV